MASRSLILAAGLSAAVVSAAACAGPPRGNAPAAVASGPTSSSRHLPSMSDSTSTPSGQPAAAFTRLHRAATSAYAEPAELVLTSDSAWRAAWAALSPNEAAGAPPAPPPVDFTRDLVVLVATGPRSSGGHDVRIDAVERDGAGGLVVRYTVTRPGPGCMSTQQVTSPVDLVRVGRPAAGPAAGPVTARFAARQVATPC